jgi:hypothetical protein
MHPPPLALAEDNARHWLRLTLPPDWSGPAEADDPETRGRAFRRMRPISATARKFLMTYSAGLIATITFIA